MIDHVADPQEFMRLRISVDRNRLDPLGAGSASCSRIVLPSARPGRRTAHRTFAQSPGRCGADLRDRRPAAGGLRHRPSSGSCRRKITAGSGSTTDSKHAARDPGTSRIAMQRRAHPGFVSSTTRTSGVRCACRHPGDPAGASAARPSFARRHRHDRGRCSNAPQVARAAWAAASRTPTAAARPRAGRGGRRAFRALRWSGAGDHLLMLTSLPMAD